MDINVLATKIKVKLDHMSILHPRGLHSLRRRAKVFSHLQGWKSQVWDPGTQISPWFLSLLDSLPMSSTHTKGLPHFLRLHMCSHDRAEGRVGGWGGHRLCFLGYEDGGALYISWRNTVPKAMSASVGKARPCSNHLGALSDTSFSHGGPDTKFPLKLLYWLMDCLNARACMRVCV